MGEIKFRGKRVENGEWVEGNYSELINYLDGASKPAIQIFTQKPSEFDRFIPVFESEYFEVIPETVGQYTGLKDKNGKEIYEGDIIKLEKSSCLRAVEWEKHKYKWIFKNIEHGSYTDFSKPYKKEIEVIGNIHDNPELLEAQDE